MRAAARRVSFACLWIERSVVTRLLGANPTLWPVGAQEVDRALGGLVESRSAAGKLIPPASLRQIRSSAASLRELRIDMTS
jgi:hypothetical protein